MGLGSLWVINIAPTGLMCDVGTAEVGHAVGLHD